MNDKALVELIGKYAGDLKHHFLDGACVKCGLQISHVVDYLIIRCPHATTFCNVLRQSPLEHKSYAAYGRYLHDRVTVLGGSKYE